MSALGAVLLFLAAASTSAEVPSKQRLVVYDLRAPPELQGLARRLTDETLIHLGKRADVEAIGEAEVDLIAKHLQDRAELGDADCKRAEECLVRLTAAAAADRLLSGRLVKLGGSFVVTLSLMDARKSVVERSEACSAEREDQLLPALAAAADAILGGEGPRAPPLQLGEKERKVAVMPLTGLETELGVAASLTQILGLELRRAGLEVVTKDEIEALVDRALLAHECSAGDDDLFACLIEIGGALGVRYLATGAIGRFDETYVVILKMIDVQNVTVLARVSESYRGPSAQLPRTMRFATESLLGKSAEGTGDLAVIGEVEAELTLDGGAAQKMPLKEPIRALSSGKHALTILAEDYFPYHAEAYVEPAAETRFEPALVPRPTPWYASWWFWTAAGVVAAAGTATTILILDPPGSGDAASRIYPMSGGR